jgi:hypothetical protein
VSDGSADDARSVIAGAASTACFLHDGCMLGICAPGTEQAFGSGTNVSTEALRSVRFSTCLWSASKREQKRAYR